ncbi:hypothetical protein JVU11DRAFT_9740 [Chiua virens]|nr:hypothetical protein JVU11DRAFT_9740 [Chiua virens]
MTRTCHFCHGYSDDYVETSLRRCAGCQKVFYCSKECQKYHWVEHIFDCKPNRPINTADYLALAVRQNLPPQHPQTCEDYGFNRAITIEEKTMLFGLYIGMLLRAFFGLDHLTRLLGLIKVMEIPPKTIHFWRTQGVLVDEIKAVFRKIPENCRGGYFPWFLQNEHIVAQAGQPPSMDKLSHYGDEMQLRAWRVIGGSDTDSPAQIRIAIERKSEEEQHCWSVVRPPHVQLAPIPGSRVMDQVWIRGVQVSRGGNGVGGRKFCDMYCARRLLDFFHAKGLQLENCANFQDILHSHANGNKSVWRLKQLIAQEESASAGGEPIIVPSIMMDYGFFNCKSDSEQRQLKRVYKAFFYTHRGDPLALHEAAIKGNIHGFLSTVVQGLRDPKFQRLMKNLYPLPDL